MDATLQNADALLLGLVCRTIRVREERSSILGMKMPLTPVELLQFAVGAPQIAPSALRRIVLPSSSEGHAILARRMRKDEPEDGTI